MNTGAAGVAGADRTHRYAVDTPTPSLAAAVDTASPCSWTARISAARLLRS